MAESQNVNFSLQQVREALRAMEEDSGAVDVDVLSTYPGEWVVVHQGRVVAHGRDGAQVAKMAPAAKYPYSRILFVPTLYQQAGVRILHVSKSDA